MVKTFAKKDDYKKHPSGDRSESTNYDHLSPISRKILEQIDGERELQYLEEKNKPTNPSLWSRAKALARSKFDVYPSAYANGWGLQSGTRREVVDGNLSVKKLRMKRRRTLQGQAWSV